MLCWAGRGLAVRRAALAQGEDANTPDTQVTIRWTSTTAYPSPTLNRWLEDDNSEETKAWVAARIRDVRVPESHPGARPLKARLTKL